MARQLRTQYVDSTYRSKYCTDAIRYDTIQEAQLSLTNRAMLVCKVVEVWCHAPDCQEVT